MMGGPEAAAARIAAWLAATVPERLQAHTTVGNVGWGEADEYPPPALVLDHDAGPIPTEDWPAIIVLPQTSTSMRFVGIEPDDADVYEVGYRVRVLAWVRGRDHADTSHIRFGYLVAIREALLQRKQAATVAAADGLFTVDPGSLREDYSDVMTDDAGRTIAGVYVDVDVLQVETVDTGPPIGTAEAIDADTRTIPPHPAL